MTTVVSRQTKRALQLSVGLSVLVHCMLLGSFGLQGSYRFTTPVRQMQAVMIDLAAADAEPETVVPVAASPTVHAPAKEPLISRSKDVAASAPTDALSAGGTDHYQSKQGITPDAASAESPPLSDNAAELEGVEAAAWTPMTHAQVPPPLRAAHEFLAKEWEKLDYRISMMGLPVGSAVLEAGNQGGGLKISLHVRSAPVFSGIYPVDDLIETRHAGGNFIMTKIRQQEGNFRSDRGFTIFLRDRRVFWTDLLKKRSVTEPIPNGQVVDLLSGLYHLRNRPLQVGQKEVLHVYDSDRYVELPVEVLRREELQLPGLTKVDTLVIKPLLETEGIFKRTGDVTIWLTDDAHKVPVKVETQISLGKVTVELIAADTDKDSAPRESVSAKAETE